MLEGISMGIFDKIKGMVGSNDLDYNEYDNDLFGDDAQNDNYDVGYDAPQQDVRKNVPPSSGVSGNGSSIELKVVKPKQFDSVTQIADHLLNKRTIVLNLEDTNKETARRLIDFLSGIAYSIDGQLKRVANNTFVITPNNVDVSGEQLRSNEPKKEESADLYSEL